MYAVKEESDDGIDEIYARGFLPYTGNFDRTKAMFDVFYLARSVRVDLSVMHCVAPLL